MNNKSKSLKIYIIFIIVIAFVTYANTLTNKFTSEDYHLIMANNFIQHWENVELLFSYENLLRPFAIRNGARPLTLLSLMIDFKFYRFNPFGYHLTNIVLHILNSILVFYLFVSLGVKRDYAFFTSLIYILHPINGEVINVPGFRGDLLATMFFILGIIFFIRIIKSKNIFLYIPVLFFYICGLLSKEIVVVLPLVLLFYLLVFKQSKKRRTGIILILSLLIIFGGMYLMFFWLERYSYDIFKVIFVNLTGNIKPYSSIISYFNTIFISFYMYIKNIFLPVALNYDYQMTIPKTISFSSFWGLVFIAAAIFSLIKIKNRISKFSLGVFLLTLLPVSNIIPLFNIIADRYMYLPMVGFSFVLLTIGVNLKEKLEKTINIKKIFNVRISFIIIVLFLSLYFGISFNRNFIFRDMLTLYEHTVKHSPENPRVRYNLAVAYKENKMFDESIRELKYVIKLNPLYKRDKAWQMLAENYYLLGKIEESKKYFVKVLLIKPKKQTLLGLAKVLFEEGNIEGSHILWQKVLNAYPRDKIALAGINLIRNSGENFQDK